MHHIGVEAIRKLIFAMRYPNQSIPWYQRNQSHQWKSIQSVSSGKYIIYTTYSFITINYILLNYNIKYPFLQVRSYIEENVALCKPDSVHICDGSASEGVSLLRLMQASRTIKRLPKYENWYVSNIINNVYNQFYFWSLKTLFFSP